MSAVGYEYQGTTVCTAGTVVLKLIGRTHTKPNKPVLQLPPFSHIVLKCQQDTSQRCVCVCVLTGLSVPVDFSTRKAVKAATTLSQSPTVDERSELMYLLRRQR